MRTPRDCSHSRSAPLTTVRTTSLTVPPNAFLTVLKSLEARTTAKRRCGPISTLSGVSGAGFSPAHTISPRPSTASRARSTAVPGRSAAFSARPATPKPACIRPLTPPAISSADDGSGLAAQASPSPGSIGLGTGSRSKSTVREVDAGDAVDQRMVGLGDQREAVALEALDQPHLPQRLRAVEALGEDPRGQAQELVLGAGLGQRGVADVVLEVEGRGRRPTAGGRCPAAAWRASGGSAGPGAGATGCGRGSRRSAAAGPRRS